MEQNKENKIEELVDNISEEAGKQIDGQGTTEEVKEVARQALHEIDEQARREEEDKIVEALDNMAGKCSKFGTNKGDEQYNILRIMINKIQIGDYN